MSDNGKNKHQLYFEEAKEQLELLEQNLLLLEQADNVDLSLVNEIFRGVHTIKGGADFLGLAKIKQLSHAAEDVLDLVRHQQLILTSDGISTLLVVIDSLKEMMADPEASQSVDIGNLLNDIQALSAAGSQDVKDTIINNTDDDAGTPLIFGTPSAPELFSLPRNDCMTWWRNDFNFYILEIPDSGDAATTESREETLSHLTDIGYIVDKHVCDSISYNNQSLCVLFRSVLLEKRIIQYLGLQPSQIHGLQSQIPDSQAPSKSTARTINRGRVRRGEDIGRRGSSPSGTKSYRRSLQEDSALTATNTNVEFGPESQGLIDRRVHNSKSIRVNVEILDDLMNFVGELVLTRNQLNQNVAVNDHNAIALAAQRLDSVTSELQASIMSTRMQPLGIVLSRFHRIIRDMSNQLGKSVNLVLEGESVELDKTIIENIGDPLTHLVRNAVDHGIEIPSARTETSKEAAGTISIKARHEAGHVVIEIADDGKGIDPEKIRKKALQLGIIDKARADEISEKELLKLVFTPGFSTAEVVSDISGRGVGLDVVYTNITSLGGAIDIYSILGEGTTFRVSLPLTLAIVPSLLVSSGNDIFVIPQINLVELVRIPPDQKKSRIENLGDIVVVRLRDRLLPLVWLDKVLNLQARKDMDDMSVNIAVVKAGDFYYGVVVDHFTDSQEIVVKPLGAHLRHCLSYAGATILGDGRAAMILDVSGIAQSVNMTRHDAEAAQQDILQKAQDNVGKEQHLLIVENGEDEYFGIELAYVNRIERVRTSTVLKTANKDVIKYRGGTLRVFKLEDAIDSKLTSRDDYVYLVVFHMMGREIAVMVSNIVDIVDTRTEVDERTFRQPGVVGSAIIMERITLLLDLFELVKVIDPTLDTGKTDHIAGIESGAKQGTVLVVEDSHFFQDKLRILLEEMGLAVLLAEDGQEGWSMLNAHTDAIDIVLTDIEMPNMNGLELARLIRTKKAYSDLPIIMLTSLAKESDVEQGIKAGANEYLVKMDQELVRRTVEHYLGHGKGKTLPDSKNKTSGEYRGQQH